MTTIYMSQLKANFTTPEKFFICNVVNHFGSGDHPKIIPSTIRSLGAAYVVECMGLYFAGRHRSREGDTLANNIMDSIKNANRKRKEKENDSRNKTT